MLVGITVSVRNSPTAQFLGVSLLSIVSFAVNLDDLVRNWTSLETAMQAIHRIQSFSLTTPSETRPGEDHDPPDEWPREGRVEFRNVKAAYELVFPMACGRTDLCMLYADYEILRSSTGHKLCFVI